MPVGGGTTFSLPVALVMVAAGMFPECGTTAVAWYWKVTAPPPVNCVPPGFICAMIWSITSTWPAAGAGRMLTGAPYIAMICAAVSVTTAFWTSDGSVSTACTGPKLSGFSRTRTVASPAWPPGAATPLAWLSTANPISLLEAPAAVSVLDVACWVALFQKTLSPELNVLVSFAKSKTPSTTNSVESPRAWLLTETPKIVPTWHPWPLVRA